MRRLGPAGADSVPATRIPSVVARGLLNPGGMRPVGAPAPRPGRTRSERASGAAGSSSAPKAGSARPRGDLAKDAVSCGASPGETRLAHPRAWTQVLRGAKAGVSAVVLAALFASAGAEAGRLEVHQGAPLSSPSVGLALAPAPFPVAGGRAVFVDIQAVRAELVIDAAAERVSGRAQVDFAQSASGFPVLDLVPSPKRVLLNGTEIPPERYHLVDAPGGAAPVRLVGVALEPGEHHLEVEYDLPSEASPVRVRDGVVSFETSLHDGRDRSLSEQYLPSNFEFDSHPTTLRIRIEHSPDLSHQVVSNGTVTRASPFEFEVQFPAHFTTSSPYLRVFGGSEYTLTRSTFESSSGRQVPIELLTPLQRDVAWAMREIQLSLRAGEELYGPYPHDKLLIDMAPTRVAGVGMEYAGAANALTYGVLRHEVGHMWVGRGARPADGRAGVVDELVTQWFGHGCPSVAGPPRPDGDEPTLTRVFGDESPYDRRTNQEVYFAGRDLILRLDEAFGASGGLAPRLSRFYQRFAGRAFTVEDFVASLHEGASAPESAEVTKLVARAGLLKP